MPRETRATPTSARGLFTSGVVALRDGHRVALFFSGRRHAGENLAEVLKHRAEELPPPIQMCDALSRNLPGELQTILAHCLAHARRQFVDVYDRFPEPCRHLLESLAVVYRNDAVARERRLSPEARLQFHQEASRPTMQQLHDWLTRQLDEKLTEPNSALGGAIGYMLRHWEKLTLFLRQAGAPLDNNVCERALKKAILHRKNALFYKTQNGARVGDLFMSLIYTCQLNQANPFDYLTQLQRHADAARGQPRALDALELPRRAGLSVDDSAGRTSRSADEGATTESRPCPAQAQEERPQPASNPGLRPSCARRWPGERKRNWWMSCWSWPRRTAGFSGSSPPGLTWRRHPTNWSPRRARPSPTRPTSTSGTSTATSPTTTKPTAK